jgi:nitronate monooxygenase
MKLKFSNKRNTQASTIEVARAALQQMKPDVLIMQGCDAGGHGCQWQGRSLFSLLPEGRQLIQELHPSCELWGSGGIGDGFGVAAAMALGANVGVIGTRLIATKESTANNEWKLV